MMSTSAEHNTLEILKLFLRNVGKHSQEYKASMLLFWGGGGIFHTYVLISIIPFNRALVYIQSLFPGINCVGSNFI
jgi:hypothetical protein